MPRQADAPRCRVNETVSKLGFASSSPREERAGRGLRRGGFLIKTPFLSPPPSSPSCGRGRRMDCQTSFETISNAGLSTVNLVKRQVRPNELDSTLFYGKFPI